jgi:hypothetical protein
MVAAGALAACSIEAASDRKLFSRLIAHVIGAATVLLILYLRMEDHSWQDLQAVVGYLSGRPQLLYAWVSALVTAAVEGAVGTNLFVCFVLHAIGLLVAFPLLSPMP